MKDILRKLPRHWISVILLVASLMPASLVLARTDVPAPTFLSSPPPGILGQHTVQSGESLYCIGRAYGVDPAAIATTNGIVNPNLIYAGMVLDIPNAPKTLPAGRVCPKQFGGAPPAPPSGCRWQYTVVPGDNLWRISVRYGVSMYAIADANSIANLNLIYSGQVLCIP